MDVNLCCFFLLVKKKKTWIDCVLRQICCIFCLCTGAEKRISVLTMIGKLVSKSWIEQLSAQGPFLKFCHSTVLLNYVGQPLFHNNSKQKFFLPASKLKFHLFIFFFLSFFSPQVLLDLVIWTCGVFLHQIYIYMKYPFTHFR